MRLGQLSRKLELKPAEIREFIRTNFKVEIDLDLNTRIEDAHADALSKQFEKKAEPVARVTTAQPIETSKPVVEITEPDNELVTPPVQAEPEPVKETEAAPASMNDETGDAFIPRPVDPDAELIKVPKIKLEGLKVVGKIELPQNKVKETETVSQTAVDDHLENEGTEEIAVSENKPKSGNRRETPKSFKERRLNSVQDQIDNEEEEYSIFKDKKGIYHFSQTQRENRKNSLERIKREKQEELRKQKKIKHYKQIVETEKKAEPAARKSKKQAQKDSRKLPEKPVRKGVWGKFLNWLKG